MRTERTMMFTLILGLAGLGLVLVVAQTVPSNIPAFPGAEGFGAYTPGGRGGRVIFVTNLNDSGPGSLRAAIEAKGPRIVVFRISGIIELKKKLAIRNPYITIAGQTAPGDGICLKGDQLSISTHDVVIRYLRVRPGDMKRKEMDAIWVDWPAENVIIDHCSASWGIDETLSVTDSKNVTVQWCFITENLYHSYHHKGPHGFGSLIAGGEGGVTFHHNLYAHHASRNPRPGGKEGMPGIILDFRNNVIYNWGYRAGYSGETAVRINYVANYLKPGPSTKESARGYAFRPGGPKTQIFLMGNVLVGFPEKSDDNRLLIDQRGGGGKIVGKPFPAPPVRTDPAEVAYRRVLEEGGAVLPKRDAVDRRIVEEVKKGSGRIIDSQDEVGGWPQYKTTSPLPDADMDGMPDEWEREHGLNPHDPSDANGDQDGDGYTNIEEYLNDLALYR